MSTGTSSGNSSRTGRSTEQVEDSLGSDLEFDGQGRLRATHAKQSWLVTADVEDGQHTPNMFGWSPQMM